jgi:hypothetical protein
LPYDAEVKITSEKRVKDRGGTKTAFRAVAAKFAMPLRTTFLADAKFSHQRLRSAAVNPRRHQYL